MSVDEGRENEVGGHHAYTRHAQGHFAPVLIARGPAPASYLDFARGAAPCEILQTASIHFNPRPSLLKCLKKMLAEMVRYLQSGGVMEDDRIIFPGDAEFKYVEQARTNTKNSRVYVLKFQGSTERLFFWMQVYIMHSAC